MHFCYAYAMTIKIRNAQPSDAPILCDAEKFWASTPGHLVSHPSELKVDSFARKIHDLNESAHGFYVVAESSEGKIMGHALLDPMGLKSISHIVRLTIVVHQGFEGQKIGQLLMEKIISWAKTTDGVEKIELLVRAENKRAIALYKKFGFIEEGRLRKRLKVNEHTYIDDLSMGLLL